MQFPCREFPYKFQAKVTFRFVFLISLLYIYQKARLCTTEDLGLNKKLNGDLRVG